jgi:hypothetical protein
LLLLLLPLPPPLPLLLLLLLPAQPMTFTASAGLTNEDWWLLVNLPMTTPSMASLSTEQ